MKFYIILLALLLAVGCSQPTELDTNIIRIENAIDNGLSQYHSGIKITSNAIYYSYSRFDIDETRDTTGIEQNDWNALLQLVDTAVLGKLSEELNCEICAVDGSSEAITIISPARTIRVEMDADKTVPEIAPLLEKLREIRSGFEENS